MWPFTRKPEQNVFTAWEDMERNAKAMGVCKPGSLVPVVEHAVPLLSKAVSTNTVWFKVGGEWAVFHRAPDRDDLHATIVTTLQRHGHLNTYELADQIVAEIVGRASE